MLTGFGHMVDIRDRRDGDAERRRGWKTPGAAVGRFKESENCPRNDDNGNNNAAAAPDIHIL